MKFGFIDTYGDGEKHEIKSYEDMLGKKLGGLTVVGIYSTEESLDFIKSYDHDYEGDLTGFDRNLTSPAFYLDNFILTWSESPDHSSKTSFLSGDWIENRSESTLLYKLSGNMHKDKKIIKSINYRVKEEDVDTRVIQTYDNRYYAKVESSYTPFYTDVLWGFDSDSGLLTLIVLFTLVTGIIAFILCRKMFLRLCGFGKRGKNSTINSENDKVKYKKVCLMRGGIIVLSSIIIALLIALLGFFITNLACNYYWLQLRFITIFEVILLAAAIVGIPMLSCLSKIKTIEIQTDSIN